MTESHTVPSWIAKQAIDTWGLVPGNTPSDIDPRNNPKLNPNYPAPAPWSGNGQASMIGAWNSAVMTPTGDIVVGAVGGHVDYGGNEVIKQPTLSEAPDWAMLRPPSGAIGYPITDGGPSMPSSSGLYSDGRPRPTHTYNSLVHVPGQGMVVTNLEYVWPNLGGPLKAYLFNETTLDWELYCDYSSMGDVNNHAGGAGYDSKRNCIWIIGSGGYNMLKIDCATRVASRHGTVGNHAVGGAVYYNAADDLVHIIDSAGPGQSRGATSSHVIFDPVTEIMHVAPLHTGTFAPGMVLNPCGDGVGSGGGTGWDEEQKRFLLWGNQVDRAFISTLTRPASGDPRTTPWTAGYLSPSKDNSVTPNPPAIRGTFGRFNYVPAAGGCFLLNAVDQQTYFYKIKEVGDSVTQAPHAPQPPVITPTPVTPPVATGTPAKKVVVTIAAQFQHTVNNTATPLVNEACHVSFYDVTSNLLLSRKDGIATDSNGYIAPFEVVGLVSGVEVIGMFVSDVNSENIGVFKVKPV